MEKNLLCFSSEEKADKDNFSLLLNFFFPLPVYDSIKSHGRLMDFDLVSEVNTMDACFTQKYLYF